MEVSSSSSPLVSDGVVRGIKFSIATFEEICTYSINDCPISHPSQLTNPFLGLPLQSGRCESCGTAEHGNCEGHFGYIQLPVPVYHPSHVGELKHILSLVCLKCMRMKKGKVVKDKAFTGSCLYCRDLPPISIKEVKTSDGALCLELRVSSRMRLRDGFWNFLDRFGFHYGDTFCRPLLPFEALNILKEIPEETKKRLSAKGFFPQNGFILQYLPVPPNCLLVPEISDGQSIMSSDISISLLKRVLNKIELIKRSRSGSPNFESHEVESNELQLAIAEYMHLRGSTKAPHDARKFALGTEAAENASKQWLEKIRTLFIRKGSGFSSRSVITGDAYIGIHEIGLPSEIAKRVTFEERVTEHNLKRLQKMVDDRLCVTYRDGNSTYAIAVGSKGHTSLRVGQVINRKIMDGDIVFINRPPSTHKHSLQAFSVYVHDEHTVKINPLVCAPLGADFDGDCVHIFYPQSLAAKAEVVELFSVEKQLLSSHSGQLNLQLVNDSLLSLKLMSKKSFLRKATAQQLGMFVSPMLPSPAVLRAPSSGPLWTIEQILQSALPPSIDCIGERHVIDHSEILKLDFNRDMLQSSLTDIITSILITKGPKEALNFFNMLQPLLMEMLSLEGFSISLKDFDVPKDVRRDIQNSVQEVSRLLGQLRSAYNELLELQVENQLKSIKLPAVAFILQSSLGHLIDSKSESAITKVLQQLGFLGLQLFDRGKLYSKVLVQDIFTRFISKFSTDDVNHQCEAYGLVKSSFFHGLNPYEELVHSISSREVIVRSSRGLTEPGTLFKNLMAILRDVVVCYDGTVRNVCSNSILQFEYELDDGVDPLSISPAGEPVGVLAATSISNPAYKAVLDSSQSTNSSWDLMKEILLCKANYRNDVIDRRVILYLNDCCGKKVCKDNAALTVQNCLKRVTLKDCATDLLIEYQKKIILPASSDTASGLVGHIHLDKMRLKVCNRSMEEILCKSQDVIVSYTRKKGQLSHIFKRIFLSASECCSSQQSNDGNFSQSSCLQFSYCDGGAGAYNGSLEQAISVMANTVCPILLDTIVKGDPRIGAVNIVWVGPDATSWVANSRKTIKREVALEVVVQKSAARQNGDAWRTVLDACLPVIHLVDTRRSIPYGIQQIEELLGISCAFDQTVQRLSKCIKMVSKGVLKEHLILVGNSMTCTGSIIGFNTGGFKALFRSLKVQVPFTEATLFTPMKCFQRAAEKSHSDSLGSVVSSCSWGKHVAIGTGTHFEVIWGQKHEVASNEDIGKDVYDLLAWVRTPSHRDLTSACLGSDVDDYEDYHDYNMPLSPDLSIGCEMPTFEEDTGNISLKNLEDNNSNWEKTSCPVQSDNWQGWGAKQQPTADNSHKSNWEKPETSAVKSDGWNGWGNRAQAATDNSLSSSREKVSPSAKLDGVQGWGNTEQTAGNNTDISSWGKAKKSVAKSDNNDGWGARDEPAADASKSSWENISSPVKSDKWQGLESRKEPSADNFNKSSWQNAEQPIIKADDSPCWGSRDPAAADSSHKSSWGKVSSPAVNKSSWQNAEKPVIKTDDSPCWGSKDPAAADSSHKSSWGKVSSPAVQSGSSKAWESNANLTSDKSKVWSSWDVDKGQQTPTDSRKSVTEFGKFDSSNPEMEKGPIWTVNKPEVESSSGWKANKGNQAWKSKGWGSSNFPYFRNVKNNSPRPPGGPDDRRSWRRSEAFTSEEEKILAEIDPIMHKMRKIIRESSEGDRLSADDQKFIADNVFHYHPDKQAKVAGEIDYIKVDRHGSFTDSRCLFVVSSDGSSADFSYLKCMENFVKENYPEHAESFNRKYFRRRRTEQPSNDDTQRLQLTNEASQQLQPLNEDSRQL